MEKEVNKLVEQSADAKLAGIQIERQI